MGGGLLNNEGTATITGTTFDGNKAKGGASSSIFAGSIGGGIANYEGGSLDIKNSNFTHNEAISSAGAGYFFAVGGAIESDSGFYNNKHSTVTISYSNIIDNLATGDTDVSAQGGGIAQLEVTPGLGTMTLVGCTVSGNLALGVNVDNSTTDGVSTADSQGDGGGIYNYGSSMRIVNSSVTNNQASAGNSALISAADPFAGGAFGGGIVNNFTSVLIITNSTIAGNLSGGGATDAGPGGIGVGGGISNSPDASMTMTNCVVLNNSAVGGQGGPGTNTHLGPNQQAGFGFGGGVDTSNNGSTATIISSLIFGNKAIGGAGGAGNNGGNGLGGGLGVGWSTLIGAASDNSQLTLIDSVVFGNIAQGGAGGAGANGGNGEGGGLFIGPTASATVTDSRIQHNIASGGAPGIGLGDTVGNGIGGGVYNDLGTFSDDLLTILAHNLATTSNNNIFP